MTRLEKIQLAIKKGYTYNADTGEVIGPSGKIITNKKNGYIAITLTINNKCIRLYAHQFAYYCKYNKIVNVIDHIDRDRTNNKISNLRSVTQKSNVRNTKHKGYYFNKSNKKWRSRISTDSGILHLGYFDNELDAQKAYLEAKKKYHKEYELW